MIRGVNQPRISRRKDEKIIYGQRVDPAPTESPKDVLEECEKFNCLQKEIPTISKKSENAINQLDRYIFWLNNANGKLVQLEK